MPTKEEAYDEKIAPLMTQLIEVCQKNQIQMHASFVLSEETYCNTHLLNDEIEPVALRLMRYAAATRANFDEFMFAVMRWSEEAGHSSAVLTQLGINPEPVSKQ